MELWGDNSAEKFAHASLLLNAWKQYEQTNIRLRYYWEQAWDENGIRRTVLEEDENLIAIEELGQEKKPLFWKRCRGVYGHIQRECC